MKEEEVLKALEEEIERAEHQMSITSGTVRPNQWKRWKKYVKYLYNIAAEISLVGVEGVKKDVDE